MKKLIITRNQLNELMDSNKSIVTFTGNNANELGVNAQEKYTDALNGGLKASSISLQGKTPNNNATDADETNISFDTTKSNIKDAVTTAVQTAVDNGADINKLSVVGNTEDVTNGNNLGESKKYTKKQVQQARLQEMKKNGKVFTKKELKESFITKKYLKENEDSLNIINKLGEMDSFKVLNVVKQVFGDDVLQNLAFSRNMLQDIINLVYGADEQQRNDFLTKLNLM